MKKFFVYIFCLVGLAFGGVEASPENLGEMDESSYENSYFLDPFQYSRWHLYGGGWDPAEELVSAKQQIDQNFDYFKLLKDDGPPDFMMDQVSEVKGLSSSNDL